MNTKDTMSERKVDKTKKREAVRGCLDPGEDITGDVRTEDSAALRGRLVAARPSPQLPALRRIQRQALHPKVQLLTSRRVRRYNSHYERHLLLSS